MDTSNIRIAASNLADSISASLQNFEIHTIGRTSAIETDIMVKHSQMLQLISKLYSDMLDLVLESNDLAKVFHIKSKLEHSVNLDDSLSQIEVDYRHILKNKLASLNANLDPSC